MSRKIPIRASLSKKAAAAVLSGLLVFSGTPITPIVQALADEPLDVETSSNPKTTPTTTPKSDGELGVEGAGGSGNNAQQTPVNVQSTSEPAYNSVVPQNTATTNVATIGETGYETLADAIDKAENGATITLQNNVDITEPIVVTKESTSFTIDLNKHNITATDNRALWIKSGDVTITGEGTISANKVQDNTAFLNTSSVIRVGNNATDTNPAKLTIGKDVTVSTNHCYGVSVFGVNAEAQGKPGMSLTLNGKILVTGTAPGIGGNARSDYKTADVTINSGAEVSAANDIGIYFPAGGTLAIAGTVSGFTGVQIRKGTLTLEEGAKITGTGTPKNPFDGKFSDGTVFDGAGVSIASNTSYGNVTVNYYGGSIASTSSVPLALFTWQSASDRGIDSATLPKSVSFQLSEAVAKAESTKAIVQGMSKYAPKDFATASKTDSSGNTTYAIGKVEDVKSLISGAESGSTIEVFDASSAGITLTASEIGSGVSIKNSVEDAYAGQSDDNSNIIRVVSTDDGSGSGNDNTINKGDETSAGAIKAVTATVEKPEIGLHDTTTVAAEASARYLITDLTNDQKKLAENDGTVTWTANPDIVTVDKDGKVTPKAAGKTTLTAKLLSKDGKPVKDLDGKEISATVGLTIQQAQLPKPEAPDQVYNGSKKTPVVIKDGDKTLVEGTDYDIAYKDNTNAGTATYKATGKGNYTGTAEGSFKIAPAQVAAPTAASGLTYNGKEQTGVKAGDQYTVANGAKTDAGDYTATATLKDAKNCTWSDGTTAPKSVKWSIAKAQVAAPTAASGLTYNGKEQTGVKAGDQYTVANGAKTDAGDYTAKATLKDAKNHMWENTKKSDPQDVKWTIARASISSAKVDDIPTQVRTGKAIEPAVTVTLGGKTLVKGTDYDVAYSNNVEAGEATATITGKGNFTDTATAKFSITEPSLKLTGEGHVQDKGDESAKSDASGLVIGTTGEAKRLEALTINLPKSLPYKGDIEYTAHVQDIGWQSWVKGGQEAGTEGQAKRIEAVQIKLTGDMAKHYNVWYRVHSQNYGWLGWAKNGEKAGTAGKALRAEAIEVLVLPVNAPAPGSTTTPFMSPISYQTHVQNLGWVAAAADGATGGTVGQAKRLEAIRINLPDVAYKGSIKYKTHIQNIGWESDYVKDGALSGTTGEAKRLEAIRIELEGEVAEHYDVWYRTHVQNYGWLGWARNGENAGSQGKALRMEAMEIMLVAKGAPAPGSTENAFVK